MDGQSEERQVTLRLSTQLPKNFRVPEQPLAVPARLTRYGLSEVVNSLLRHGTLAARPGPTASHSPCRRLPSALPRHFAPLSRRSETHVPFDFLIDDVLLQTSLHAYLVSRGISAVRRQPRRRRRRLALVPRRPQPTASGKCALRRVHPRSRPVHAAGARARRRRARRLRRRIAGGGGSARLGLLPLRRLAARARLRLLRRRGAALGDGRALSGRAARPSRGCARSPLPLRICSSRPSL